MRPFWSYWVAKLPLQRAVNLKSPDAGRVEEVSAVGGVAVEGLLPGVGIGFAADGEFGSSDFAGRGFVEPGHPGEEIVVG
jgi:hypothetical protein